MKRDCARDDMGCLVSRRNVHGRNARVHSGQDSLLNGKRHQQQPFVGHETSSSRTHHSRSVRVPMNGSQSTASWDALTAQCSAWSGSFFPWWVTFLSSNHARTLHPWVLLLLQPAASTNGPNSILSQSRFQEWSGEIIAFGPQAN
jgi:hypothetical protein